MSTSLDRLRALDHTDLAHLVDSLQPRDWAPGEQAHVEQLLDQADPAAHVEVLPPLRQAA
jgi:hypothetical protein